MYVGRACVDTCEQAELFVEKTIEYIDRNPGETYRKQVLLAGEYLGFGGISEWGGNIMEELIDGCTEHGYTTEGIPDEPDKYKISTLLDRDWEENDWPKSELIQRINNGVHIINHLGHGNIDYAMKLRKTDIDSLQNDDLCFIYSQACLSGHFDQTDCLAEYLTCKTEYGAVAIIMNTREGWGKYYSTDGASQRYNREFWDAIFYEDIIQISRANQDSKEDNIYRINEDSQIMRWVFYELTLFGDPTLGFEKMSPEKPQKPGGTEEGQTGENYLYSTTTIDPDRNLVYFQWDWGDGTQSEWLGPYDSEEQLETAHRWGENGVYNVKVKAKDTYGLESDWSDPLSVAMPVSQQTQQCKILRFFLPQGYLS